jgi:8-oxo-dGTP pyrophosphatase MutT (NUDIX family)
MANSELYDKSYKIPEPLIAIVKAALVKYPNSEGIKRAKTIVYNGVITYQNMERLKNFFKYYQPVNGDTSQFELAGGNDMKNWVDRTLDSDRKAVEFSKHALRDVSNDVMQDTHAQSSTTDLKEWFSDSSIDGGVEPDENALAVIFNDDKKILLLKRAPTKGVWGAGKWSLIGGGVEAGELPEVAAKREVKEETGIVLGALLKTFTLQRRSTSIEHCFVSKYNGDPDDIRLNNENTSYGWFSPEEMSYLDTVPNLMDYINMAVLSE